jgi:hypothetical protein
MKADTGKLVIYWQRFESKVQNHFVNPKPLLLFPKTEKLNVPQKNFVFLCSFFLLGIFASRTLPYIEEISLRHMPRRPVHRKTQHRRRLVCHGLTKSNSTQAQGTVGQPHR